MEVLYRKLYDKYTRLKSNKLSDLDHLNEEQELKFRNFSSAAEELIEHLMTEKEELLGQVHHLRSELASLRAAKDNQVVDYQRLLMEETRKNEALSEEVEKLLKLRQEGTSHDLNYNSKIMTLDDQFKANYSSSVRMTRKRTRQNALEKEARLISFENDQANSVERESTENTCKETASGKLLEGCTKANDQPGIDVQESGRRNWLIQVLFEYALGMKLSTDYQTEGICLSAVHQSSGYSFSLSWISKSPDEEAELLYHVLSLGTFERVAPEWMREDIMFSPSMCPIFFERVYRVIKLNH
ncbi:hypothetical protein AAZX31_10G065000 [Glycine max]|uniref:DUF7806 domain-containing protein n=3 Tax=Glycine subgen. Soja TaxID=1462606 RepID=I1L9A8_SOYBN|nr:interaptin [Glycine max]XP_028182922.1 interaptin-like [Glycine soja]KAH1137140.1 hypothetical protein GYH30_027217 [Glycine max]KAH1227884.1 hypothetical protein GmHk_10G028007 [Glycine max]KHN32232.1 hypothetical protein glysoja_042659 [Glycine soja]KRH32709.1 hypothetical protein GLYMA_10G069400v4 [Glycine max]RZB86084.1 hypothetical protein D0Y65_026235 [Glycine soja]|eukprot:XP_025979833.1 interaptin-like [Glycine max]